MFWLTVFLLYLSVFIKRGYGRGFGPGEQDWGYVEIRHGSHMFWWLYYVNSPIESRTNFNPFFKPLLIWLQGHPKASASGFGNFAEIGPLDVNLQERNYTWINNYNVLFIDCLGTGFSYLENGPVLPRSSRQMAEDTVETVRGFLEAIPEFKHHPVYILGEFYSGKIAVETAFLWYKIQERRGIESDLRGIAIGDSLISPADTVLSYAPFLLSTGLINPVTFKKMKIVTNKIINAMNSGHWNNAINLWDYTLKIASNNTGNVNFIKLFQQKAAKNLLHYYISHQKLFNDSRTRQMLTIIMNNIKKILDLNATYTLPATDFHKDFTKPVNKIVERLLNETSLRVIVWSGELNFDAVTPGKLVWVEKLKWKNAETWKNYKTNPLVIDNITQGYTKEYDNFIMFWIQRISHSVVQENFRAMEAILQSLTADI